MRLQGADREGQAHAALRHQPLQRAAEAPEGLLLHARQGRRQLPPPRRQDRYRPDVRVVRLHGDAHRPVGALTDALPAPLEVRVAEAAEAQQVPDPLQRRLRA
eukprot:5801101-Alexandrium_andersonii.AAC.1